jgi:hypothetical protein
LLDRYGLDFHPCLGNFQTESGWRRPFFRGLRGASRPSFRNPSSSLVGVNNFRYLIATMKRKIGVALIVLSYALLLYFSLASPSYAHAHPQMAARMLARYSDWWPVALGSALAIGNIVLALIPIRRGERWALLSSLATSLILLGTKLATDPRCLVVLDPHKHGCHTFMITIILGLIGLALAAFGR